MVALQERTVWSTGVWTMFRTAYAGWDDDVYMATDRRQNLMVQRLAQSTSAAVVRFVHLALQLHLL